MSVSFGVSVTFGESVSGILSEIVNARISGLGVCGVCVVCSSVCEDVNV